MLTLIKKDCRVNAVAIAGSAILQVMIYIVMIVLGLVAMYYNEIQREDVRDGLIAASFMGLAVMALMAAVYGAGAFALERRERSADFLTMLPAKKWRVVVSKLLTATGCLLVIWLINVATLLIAHRGSAFGRVDFTLFTLDDRMQIVTVMTAVALMTFGIGWLFSTFLNSASVAASISIATTLAMVIGVEVALDHLHQFRVEQITFLRHSLILRMSIVVGLVSFTAGTINYLRRVEP